MKVSSETVIITLFYIILITIIIQQFKKILNSPTAFEEHEESDDTKVHIKYGLLKLKQNLAICLRYHSSPNNYLFSDYKEFTFKESTFA